ncbi:MAG: hypothetical protein V4579_10970 [Pseudomonadota bacterium]
MPVVISAADWATWLQGESSQAFGLCRPWDRR